MFFNVFFPFIVLLIFSPLLVLEKGKGEEKDRERIMDGREKQQSIAACLCLTGEQTSVEACALTDNQTGNFLPYGTIPSQLSNNSQGWKSFFNIDVKDKEYIWHFNMLHLGKQRQSLIYS